MLPGAPPFVEVEAVLEARRLAARLASSPLPILVAGAIGTGRRTLANALGTRSRTADSLGTRWRGRRTHGLLGEVSKTCANS